MNKLLNYFLLPIIIVSSCSTRDNNLTEGSIGVKLINQMELSIPEMQAVFRNAPQRINNFWVYYDPYNEAIISLNSNFTFHSKLIVKGEGPQEIVNIYSYSVTEEYVFVLGPRVIAVFDKDLHLIGKYPFSLDMAYSVIPFNNGFLTAGFNEDDPQFSLFSFVFSESADKIELVKQQELNSKFIEERMYYSYKLVNINDKVLLIFDWYGEYFLFDTNYNILKTEILPFSGDMEFFLDESVVKPPYYQAYDTKVYNDSLIFIVRELDFEQIGDNLENEALILKNYRNTISVFTAEMEFKNNIKLPNEAVNLSIFQDTLITNSFNSEQIEIYEITSN
ncbi:MAG: hypothetical protein ACJAT1_001210 [Marivirga sp.]|jgi:hypothetical protein